MSFFVESSWLFKGCRYRRVTYSYYIFIPRGSTFITIYKSPSMLAKLHLGTKWNSMDSLLGYVGSNACEWVRETWLKTRTPAYKLKQLLILVISCELVPVPFARGKRKYNHLNACCLQRDHNFSCVMLLWQINASANAISWKICQASKESLILSQLINKIFINWNWSWRVFYFTRERSELEPCWKSSCSCWHSGTICSKADYRNPGLP